MYFIPKFLTIKKGSRLTDERVRLLNIGDFLINNKRNLLLGILFNREAALL